MKISSYSNVQLYSKGKFRYNAVVISFTRSSVVVQGGMQVQRSLNSKFAKKGNNRQEE